MSEAPQRIWLDWPDANKGDVVYDEPPERPTQPGQTGYVRADLHDTALDEIVRLRDGWSEEPESNDAWCAGNQFALDRLCKVLGVNPDDVDWDCSDGSLNEEADGLIWRILNAHPGFAAHGAESAPTEYERKVAQMKRDSPNGI